MSRSNEDADVNPLARAEPGRHRCRHHLSTARRILEFFTRLRDRLRSRYVNAGSFCIARMLHKTELTVA